MPALESFVSPSREELATWSDEKARKIDEANREIFKRNKLVVSRARQILLECAPAVTAVRDLQPPAIPIEYARKTRELAEKEREREAREDS
ncbi:MAG: hypothetical protein JNK11_02240 [Alphaproteobacteria bacterium]|nr:hypothetical protein [Alphaproteobacteria bacterium]